ncbi:CDP-glycerol glycerophosphotransferase family protein [Thalassotalea castellviae]|uniref:CDP-glycerol glycerophosphotransferase family protein n=1 Tax=Thalassotalea castellviae TaxID=3075612 RepID=A0ABU2ZXZ0_9GAMM|nr:CDP-glycerol glycerophosphotransferase family protein [Thalassotalea sp. W431]MDT0602799.1 CDP-glycerol glycerophosphotransferase family protein [Thalassotalea sp. W431]
MGKCFPRNSKIWVFGSAYGFEGNSKYLYCYTVEHTPDIRAIWIAGSREDSRNICSKGAEAYYRWSIQGIWLAFRSKYWFFNVCSSDVNYVASGGAWLVNLWHGVPLKKIHYDVESFSNANRYKKLSYIIRKVFLYTPDDEVYENLVSTSKHVSDMSFSSALRVPAEQCLNFGYPRLDPLFWDQEYSAKWQMRWSSIDEQKFIKKVKTYDKAFIFMPTWRDHAPHFIKEQHWDFIGLDKKLAKKNTILILKLHPLTPLSLVKSVQDCSNIELLDSGKDVYCILPHTHGLITDYSSIMFDYALLDRPICYFAHDLDDYLDKSREFYMPFDEVVYGPVVTTMEQVERFLLNHESITDSNEARERIKDLYFDYKDHDSSKRIVAHFTQ